MFNQVVTTMDMYKDVVRNSGLIDASRCNTIKEYQTVIAVGPSVNNIKPGDTVFINPRRYMKITHKNGKTDLDQNITQDDMHVTLDIPRYELYDKPDGGCREVLMIFDNDIIFVAEGEEFDENGGLLKPSSGIVQPSSPIAGFETPSYGKPKN